MLATWLKSTAERGVYSQERRPTLSKVRRCDDRCHRAKKPRCRCWCGGAFHGSNGTGAANREALAQGMPELLEQHGFKEGETAYIEQKELALEVS